LFIKTLDPTLQLPCRISIQNKIEKPKKKTSSNIKDNINKIYYFPITSDGWSSNLLIHILFYSSILLKMDKEEILIMMKNFLDLKNFLIALMLIERS